MGELPPDQQGRSDGQSSRAPAIGNIIGAARSWGPDRPFASYAALLVQGETGQLPASLLNRQPPQTAAAFSATLLQSFGTVPKPQLSSGTTFQGPGALPDELHTQRQAPAPRAPVKRLR